MVVCVKKSENNWKQSHWCVKILTREVPFPWAVLQAQVNEVVVKLGKSDFKATNWSLQVFRNRNIVFEDICGEQDIWQKKLWFVGQNIICYLLTEGYAFKDIANLDETMLLFYLFPIKHFVVLKVKILLVVN